MHDLQARLLDAHRHGDLETMLVDERDSGSWPWVWYLHDVDGVSWATIDPAQPLPRETTPTS